MDLARSVQDVTEEAVLRIARHVRKETGMRNLCLAGGVALNCVANGKALRAGIFDDIWIQPAAGDAGGALGAALLAWHQYAGKPRTADGRSDSQKGSYLGPEFSNLQIKEFLDRASATYKELDTDDIPSTISGLIADEKVIGWFQGRMEFGPRALGGRTIIGDARSSKMQETMNLKIKYRESFRPFAPSVLAERVSDYFEIDRPSPYMLLVAQVKKERQQQMSATEESLFGLAKLNIVRSEVPAITHVDYSARLQTAHRDTNPLYHRMIARFDEDHGCPVIINTSFNVRGEPIVCNPEDAFLCFMRTEMDYLLVGNYLLDKKEQRPLADDSDWRKEFQLD